MWRRRSSHLGISSSTWCASKSIKEAAQARVDELAGRIEEELEDVIYSSQGETLEQIVLYYLEMRAATLSVAESCTGDLSLSG